MKTFHIQGAHEASVIYVGAELADAAGHIEPGRTAIVTDPNVSGLYRDAFPGCPVIEMGLGEKHKTLDTAAMIFERLLDLGADRSWTLLGIGGGIVCDVTGFVASTYMRGIRFGFVSTTLLSQVDASVGGKNGVNYKGYKNMVGIFRQPEFVICDLNMLKTLPEKERSSGFAEIVKHAAIADAALFSFLEENADAALALDRAAVERMVYDSVRIKAGVVGRDETEKGERRKLNFGHTLGHAVEKVTGVTHGEAVGMGMAAAARISADMGLIPAADADRLTALIERFNLPVNVTADPAALHDAFVHDKKRQGADIHFVLLEALGSAVVKRMPAEDLWERLSRRITPSA